ncbi:MAG: hypothetical protein LBR64_05740, partial [Dysgonamonadaceae bacterium]|nr:hypothetical protein [Dysgonamonadaceae bacterium]
MKNLLFVLAFTTAGIFRLSAAADEKVIDGYPIANFAVTANYSGNGDFFGNILQNTGELGEWLLDKGAMPFWINNEDKSYKFSDYRDKTIVREFPFVKAVYKKQPDTPMQISVEAFCPLAINDAKISALPVIMLEISSEDGTLSLGYDADAIIYEDTTALTYCKEIKYAGHTANGFGSDKFRWNVSAVQLPDSTYQMRFLLSFFDKTWTSANQFKDINELSAYVFK